MTRRRTTTGLVAATLAVACGAVWLCSCSQKPSGPTAGGTRGSVKDAQAPSPQWDDSYAAFSDAGVYLLPVGPKEASRRPAQEVWKSLLPGMASDASTKALLRRLYNDLPVDFVVLPEAAAKDKAALDRAAGSPGAGFAVALRIAAERPLREAGDADLFGSLGCRRDMRVKPGEKTANFVEKDGGAVSSRPPNDFLVVLFAMNDYLLRTRAGYSVFDGGAATPQSIRSEFPTQDAEAMRTDLDRRVDGYLKGYSTTPK
jgi:hypothetical protein